MPYAQTEGLIGSLISLLGLTPAVFDHSTLSRRAATLEAPQAKSSTGIDVKPLHLPVDSTGLKLCGAGEWLIEKHGTKTRRSWRKLHICMDAETGEIVVAVRTTAALTTNDDACYPLVYAEGLGHGVRKATRVD